MLNSLDDEAHIWLAFVAQHQTPGVIKKYETLLSDDEKRRHARYHFKRHRRSFLLSHALLRTTLSRYMNISPDKWSFKQNAHGRPEIYLPGEKFQLRFNLSRTEYAAVCLITSSVDGGIDIEYESNLKELQLLINNVLSPQEMTSLHGLSVNMLKERFLTYWTLKEAFVKALGIGLSLPLTQIAFQLEPDGNAKIVLYPENAGRPSEWQFVSRKLSNDHVLSVALRKEEHVDFKIKMNVVESGLSIYSPYDNFQ